MANYTSTHTGATIDASVTIVSGSGVTQSDLTKLNAVTSSAVELNLLDGVTASTIEINILDGLTASTTELNYLDGIDSSITTLSLPDNTTITTFGASLIDDADAGTARTTLGVDVAGTDNSTDVTLVTTSHDYLSISGQAITLGSIDISDDTNLVGGTGITLTGDTLSTTDSEIVHDNLSGFVANEHIDHSSVSITAGTGLSGGGDLTSTRTLTIDTSVVTLGGTQTLTNKSIDGNSNTITNVDIVDDTINTLTIARGGTGGTSAAAARSNLNVDVAGTDNSTDVTLVTTSHDYLSLSGQEVTLGQVDISDDTNLVGGTGITLTGDTLSTTDSEIVHDDLSGFVSNEHIDHSTVSITAGTGLSGGGDITSTRTLTTDDSAIVHDNLSGFVANEHIDHSGVSITAGAGLTGGGDITATRDIAVGAGTGVTVNADDIAIGQDVGTNADVTFNSVIADNFIGALDGAVKFEAKATVALNKGDAVYVVGVSGNTPTIALADANDATKMPSFGLVGSSASIDDIVEVVTFGTLKNINTSSFSEGDILFISSNGTAGNTLTATKEGGESVLCQNIGKVIRSHATVGSIKVGGAGRANATPNLNDGNIFIGNGSNQAVSASLNTKIEDYLDGGTSTANFDTISVDGAEITATPAELNVLDGITSTTAELNYTDGVTSNIQTQLDLKAPLASPAFTGTATGANLTLSGDLTVNGSTTTLDTTNLAVEDNLMELNAGVTSNANDSGFLIERGTTGDNAIFMWDESADKFTLGTTTATGTTTGDITLSSTGTLVANVEGDVTGAVTGNADTATALATARNFSLTGDVTAGAVSFDGSGNVALATTIAANSVALGTDTTGNYMSDLTEGTGIDISHTPGEGSNGTITLDLTEVGFGGGANRLITDDGDGTVSTEANLTFDGTHLSIASTGRIYLDGGGDTFWYEAAANVPALITGGTERFRVNNVGNVQFNTPQADANFRISTTSEVNTFFVDAGTDRVGIGTNSPGYKLQVSGGDIGIDVGERLYFGGGNHTYISEDINDRVRFFCGGDEFMRFTEDTSNTLNFYQPTNFQSQSVVNMGNVGIGTNSPKTKLDVENTTAPTLSNDTHAGEAIFLRSGGSAGDGNVQGVLAFGKADGSSRRSGSAIASVQTDSDVDKVGIGFYTSDSSASSQTMDQRMLLDHTGNVGIGTTSPSNTLEVKSGSTTPFGIKNASNSTRLQVSLTNDDADIFLYDRNGTLQTALRSEGNTYFNQGNVLIGASSNRTTVSGYSPRLNTEGAGASGYVQIVDTENSQFHGGTLALHKYRSGGIAANTELGSLYFGGTDSANSTYAQGALIKAYAQGTDSTSNVATDLAFFTNTGSAMTRAMTIDNSQNVGIGTTSPGTKLHISSGSIDEVLRLEGTGSPYFSVYDSGTRQFFLQSSGDTVNFYAENDNTIAFFTSGNRGLDIDVNRNLKIYDNGTNPTASTENAFLFCDSGELKVLDDLGNTTTISPHNFSLIPGGASEERAWGYYSEKDIVDDEGTVTATQKVNVDMMKLARLVEELTGEKLVYTEED